MFVFNSTWKIFLEIHLEVLFRFFFLLCFICVIVLFHLFVCLFVVKRKLTMKVS